MASDELVPVTQTDREAAAGLIEAYWPHDPVMLQLASEYRAGHAQGVWPQAFAKHRLAAAPAASPPSEDEVERDIRIAIWNAGKWQGQPDEVAQSLIRKAMSEPTMQRALAALSRPQPVERGLREAAERVIRAADAARTYAAGGVMADMLMEPKALREEGNAALEALRAILTLPGEAGRGS